eukprot:TRINITY_DN4815_c0_g1_i1.p1 TRINITY_DN4815_c0_g1~~TRINITY_DN4815_c0_g1_i1.p1  ORF type:complete len:246 (+),score=113.93 TRINITY_DN4815_c0_g1_i1:42-740(+)
MAQKTLLVYGGAGQLGQAILRTFKLIDAWKVISVDFRASQEAHESVILSGDVEADVTRVAEQLTAGGVQLDAVVCVAGGWVGEDIKSKSIFKNVDKMHKFNVESSIACSHIAAHFLKPEGLLVLTGASAALNPTPGMIAYGITKAATHHLVKSLAAPGSGLPENSAVLAILPACLDTATNREAMPNANFDDWTPLEEVARLLINWTSPDQRPVSGSLVQLITNAKVTQFIIS